MGDFNFGDIVEYKTNFSRGFQDGFQGLPAVSRMESYMDGYGSGRRSAEIKPAEIPVHLEYITCEDAD